ncbi:ATP-binding cassette, subfamily B [Filimonas lacunae]|uniref:ATP-binding cassette, subfamily B n=1 Tax=Filimonas lacunae TaxID=477680 RepID=A0A173MFZ7_9BACT|nr:ABC transporter ATP-binding protein/permease [Filimonas lacunae]BAV06552.1 ABC transporter, ATP binding/permease protein [Filimonas lacunae]SIT27363.1 ATP-binding cassette, subfamily B [Filimonas lacunae]
MNLAGNNSLLNEIFYDTFIFEDTIYNNIRFGRMDAREAEIWAVADVAKVIDFAWNMSKGMQTMIGGKHVLLTASQKLRIGLARTLLRQTAVKYPGNDEPVPFPYGQQLAGKNAVMIMASELAMIKNEDLVLVLD